MKILVTGAAGFIGAHIVQQAQAVGHVVIGVDLMLPLAHGEDAQAPAGVRLLDVRDVAQWEELLVGVDVVCHQSAVVGSGISVDDFPAYASHNDLGTAALLAAMARRGVRRLVQATSMVVYGEGRYRCADHGAVSPPVRPAAALDAGDFEVRCPTCARALTWAVVPEEAPLDPRSAYAASKVAQEHYANAWARQVDGAVISLRYHNVYGPGMPRDTPYAGVAALFRSSLARGESPRVFEDGAQMRDFVHVADVARANLLALAAVGGVAGPFNVCSGSPISIAQVATHLGAASGISPVTTGEYRLGDVRHVVASPARAERDLGFVAAIGPEQGLAEFAHAPLRGASPA